MECVLAKTIHIELVFLGLRRELPKNYKIQILFYEAETILTPFSWSFTTLHFPKLTNNIHTK
jgi:hypothetical protein